MYIYNFDKKKYLKIFLKNFKKFNKIYLFNSLILSKPNSNNSKTSVIIYIFSIFYIKKNIKTKYYLLLKNNIFRRHHFSVLCKKLPT